MATITLIGLGPGDPMLLTRAAWEALQQAATIYTPVPDHPALAAYRGKVRPLDADNPDAAATALFAVAQREAAVCALPGHPPDAPLGTRLLQSADGQIGIIAGVAVVASRPEAAGAGSTAAALRSDAAPVPTAVRPWCEVHGIGPYTPPPSLTAADTHTLQPRSFDSLHRVVIRLLGPGGCPWDVQQTHQSQRGNLLEEVYEVLESLDAGDMAALCEELGDLLMQVLVHSEMARQAGHFAIGDVLEHITSKLIRRHPHVFAELAVSDADDVLHNWEQIKSAELSEKGRERTSALDGIPAALPALAACQKMGHKAAKAGFDWPTLEKIWAKLREELDELEQAYQTDQHHASAASRAHLAEELGDTLYALVQVARWLELDAESALREANTKFRRRFVQVEQAARVGGRRLAELTLDEKIALWQHVKQEE